MSCLEYNAIVRKTFGSKKEGFLFYNKYARGKGFSVRKSYCEWNKGKTERILRRLVCSCEGFREEKELMREDKKRRPRNITRVGCLARIVIALDKNTERWYVKEFIYEHNHPMADEDLACFLRSHRRISDEQKAEIVAFQISGIRKHQIMDIMEVQYGGYDKVGFTTRDLYNFCHRNKVKSLAAGDAQTVLGYLRGERCKDPDFFFDFKTDEKGHLTGLLWCYCQCRLDYATFGDVIIFDSTYKTNRYNLPLVPIVGVNHHGSTVLFAFPPVRKSTMYDYSDSLQRYQELHNISKTASFVASHSPEAYERLKHFLYEEAAMVLPNEEDEEDRDKWYGSVLPQALDDDSADTENVLDPMHVQGRGAPKKKLKSISDKNRSTVKCTKCKGEGHNRRTCSMRKEETKLPEDVLDI